MKTRQQMTEFGLNPDPAPAVMYFLTARLTDKEISDLQKMIPRRDVVEAWRDLEDNAKELAKRLTGKEAATPSRTWKLLSESRPEMILFLEGTAKQQAVVQKIRNFLGRWRQVQQKLPLPEMAELHITPQLPEYPKIAQDAFMLLLDGKLRSRTEILKFLKPLAPPPPPPPPPPKRGRAAKAAAAGANQPTAAAAQAAGKKKGKAVPSPAPTATPAKQARKQEKAKTAAKPAKAAPAIKPAKAAPAIKPAKAAPAIKPAKAGPAIKPAKAAPSPKPATPAPKKKAKKQR
jgi:hypothetical protein